MADLFNATRDGAGESISDLLSKYGIRHEPGPSGKRYLFTDAGCIGQADAFEALNLLGLLSAATLAGANMAIGHIEAAL